MNRENAIRVSAQHIVLPEKQYVLDLWYKPLTHWSGDKMTNISNLIFYYENEIVLNIPINNTPALCEMSWWQTNEMHLSEPMMH